jgi:glycosyltransferase involved in cell wall biosynthesis
LKTPKVSVLTSCFNADKFIAEAVESILCQSFADFELILIDDGSTDMTWKILKAYEEQDRRIVLIKKSNTGLTDSLNIGLKAARGDWIARMDADDIALPERLAAQITFAERKMIGLLGTGCTEIDVFGNESRQYQYPSEHAKIIKQMERGGSCFPHSSAIFKRDTVLIMNGYRNRLNGAEDCDLWLRMSAQVKLGCLRDPLIKLRKHERSITGTLDCLRIRRLEILRVAALVCHFIRLQKMPDPSQGADENWEYFLDWLGRQLEEKAVFVSKQNWQRTRNDWFVLQAEPFLKRYLSRTKLLIRHPDIWIRRISNMLVESNFTRKLANEWVKEGLHDCRH